MSGVTLRARVHNAFVRSKCDAPRSSSHFSANDCRGQGRFASKTRNFPAATAHIANLHERMVLFLLLIWWKLLALLQRHFHIWTCCQIMLHNFSISHPAGTLCSRLSHNTPDVDVRLNFPCPRIMCERRCLWLKPGIRRSVSKRRLGGTT